MASYSHWSFPDIIFSVLLVSEGRLRSITSYLAAGAATLAANDFLFSFFAQKYRLQVGNELAVIVMIAITSISEVAIRSLIPAFFRMAHT
jgi:hypothetical protein